MRVELERLGEHLRVLTTCGKFTFVALDSKGKSTTVPPVVPETEEEKLAYDEAKAAYEIRKSQRARSQKS